MIRVAVVVSQRLRSNLDSLDRQICLDDHCNSASTNCLVEWEMSLNLNAEKMIAREILLTGW